MVNDMQKALIAKDMKNITSNKRLFPVLLIVPLALTLVMPTIFILSTAFVPVDSSDFKMLLDMVSGGVLTGDPRLQIIDLVLNSIMPLFFLLVPIMSASVMAASSFVGEKEKRTLETLLYCPLTLRQIFTAKILASFLVSMLVSMISFIAMVLAVEVEVVLITGSFILPGVTWLILLLLVSPAISLIAITLIVRGSAKAQTMEESQQKSLFLVLPIILLVAGQFAGVVLINAWIILALGVALAAGAFLALRASAGKFQYETLLQ